MPFAVWLRDGMAPPRDAFRQAARRIPLAAGAAAERAGLLARAVAASQVKWRVLAIILIPVAVWMNANLYRYVPETAAGFAYEVKINRITGHSCVVFETHPAPESLKRLRCR